VKSRSNASINREDGKSGESSKIELIEYDGKSDSYVTSSFENVGERPFSAIENPHENFGLEFVFESIEMDHPFIPDIKILNSASGKLEANQINGILGPSGCGK
jgi:ABC-type multidrug transport system ATPase subunit